MVSKTKTKTRKKGKQTRGTKKSSLAKKKGAKKTSTRLARPKKMSTRAQRSSASRNPVLKPSEQDNKLLTEEDASSLSSVDQSASYSEHQGESQLTPSDTTLDELTTTDQSSLGTEENIEDRDSGTSEIV
jgi:hypothetical protein